MSTKQDKEVIKELLCANMFDGDSQGTINMKVTTLLDDVADIISQHYILQAKADPFSQEEK